VFTASDDARYLGFRYCGSISLYDRATRRITACRARGSEFSSNARVKPFAVHLVTWLSGEGVHEVHAALVGRAGAGVLLAGASGAGKSTSAMACVRHGLDFLGDDVVGLEPRPDGTCAGHSLFGGVSLAAADVDRFGVPAVHLDRAVRVAEKQCLFPMELGYGRTRDTVHVAAVLLLHGGAGTTELEPAKRSAVLTNVAKNAMWTVVPRPGAAAMAAIARLAENVPGYRLRLGPDPNDTPAAVERLLADLTAR
jgi:hypothetical protein